MELKSWSPEPQEQSGFSGSVDELLVTFDRDRSTRILVIPAFFDEANKLRRFTLTVMRALDEAGVDSALPDWPGCNESRALLSEQSIENWQHCVRLAAQQCAATHVLSIRAGALIAPQTLPGWRYAPVQGGKLLSTMLRAQSIAEREAGRSETREALLDRGRTNGIRLGGWALGPAMVQGLESADLTPNAHQTDIEQSELGGSGLWLRAEPGENAEQSRALARIIAQDLAQEDATAS